MLALGVSEGRSVRYNMIFMITFLPADVAAEERTVFLAQLVVVDLSGGAHYATM